MKRIFPALFYVTGLLIIGSSAFAQDTTGVKSDSVVAEEISFTPYYSQSLRSSGNYMVKVDDPDILQLSSGVNIFNALRGKVPGLFIDPYAPFAKASLRGSYSALIIDGVPFNESIDNYYNLNASEYSSISAVSGDNALTFVNQQGNGAFVIASKTGEGYLKPVFEFDSYSTLGLEPGDEREGFLQQSPLIDGQQALSNTLSYRQDFGKTDTRVSYNFLSLPGQIGSFTSASLPSYHSMKVNTGFQMSPKFAVRVILDDQYHRYDFKNSSDTAKGNYNFLQGNIRAKYELADGIQLSSQVVLSQLDSTELVASYFELDKKMNRLSGNIFLNIEKAIDQNFVLTGFTGFQMNTYKHEFGGHAYREINNVKLSAADYVVRAGVNYKKFLYSSGIYRLSNFKSDIKSFDGRSSYSLSTAFIFSELVDSEAISFGKIRFSVGKNMEMPYSSYPVSIRYRYEDIFTSPRTHHSIETGVDMDFLESKIKVSTNFFQRSEEYTRLAGQNVARKLSANGWEGSVWTKIIQKKKLDYTIGVVTTAFRGKFEYGYSRGYSKSDWITNLTNQLNWKNVVFIVNIENIRINSRADETTLFKLRDVSVGYKIDEVLKSQRIKSIWVSLSARNLVTMKSEYDFEENTAPYQMQKSISLNLNVVF